MRACPIAVGKHLSLQGRGRRVREPGEGGTRDFQRAPLAPRTGSPHISTLTPALSLGGRGSGSGACLLLLGLGLEGLGLGLEALAVLAVLGHDGLLLLVHEPGLLGEGIMRFYALPGQPGNRNFPSRLRTSPS